jgi:50S ribosomal subunit-associated GTPase HflX
LIADRGGDEQISTATRILAEVIASDASWLMVFNDAIDHISRPTRKQRDPQAALQPKVN